MNVCTGEVIPMNQTVLDPAHQSVCQQSSRSSVSSFEAATSSRVCDSAAPAKKTCSSSYYALSFLIPFTAVTSFYAIDSSNCMGVAVLAGALAGGCGYTVYKLVKLVRHSRFSGHSHSS